LAFTLTFELRNERIGAHRLSKPTLPVKGAEPFLAVC